MQENSNHSPTPSPVPSTLLESLLSQQAEQQLLSELAQAAQAGMVATRSHDHVLQGVDANSQREAFTPQSSSRKRKSREEEDTTPGQDASKRRRYTSRAVAVVVGGNDTQAEKKESPYHETDKSGPTEVRLQLSARPVDVSTPLLQRAESNPEPTDPLSTLGDTVATPKEEHKRSIATPVRVGQAKPTTKLFEENRSSRKISGSQAQEARSTRLPTSGENAHAGNSNPATPAKAVHKRFGSEEVGDQSTEQAKTSEPGQILHEEVGEEGEDSEDDAPEAIPTVAGLDQVRAAAAEAERVAKQQQEFIKAKRREHDKRMKSQAKPTKKSLPALLPDEILAAEPVVRPPTPPMSPDRPPVNKKQRFLGAEPRAPKDLKRGNTRIRVLQVEKTTLPPKSSTASKSIREAWLMGQRGLQPGAGVPRRQAGGGFVRKR